MKTPKKNDRGLYLQKRNNRWKWMVGATAATAGGVSASQASTITINLVNNYINLGGGNHLNSDLTGDGHPDLTIANVYVGSAYKVFVTLNGVGAFAAYDATGGFLAGHERLGGRDTYFYTFDGKLYGNVSLKGSIPIFFKDLHINGGEPTRGSLEVTVSAFNNGAGDAVVQLNSLTYNTPVSGAVRAVPDQGSSLALLAMGAGGVLALRRWRAGQGRS